MPQSPDSQETIERLRARLLPLFTALRQTVVTEQQGVPTFYNVMARTVRERLESLPAHCNWQSTVEPFLHEFIEHLLIISASMEHGRFVKWSERVSRHHKLDELSMCVSQGTRECMHWKGLPIFKTIYEFSVNQMMIWELSPATVIELGSGTGSSAVWYADLLKLFGNPGQVISLDIHKPKIEHERVTFIQHNIFQIDLLFNQLQQLPKPWLIIEDAHVNIEGVLTCFDKLMHEGDYLIIEDSSNKQLDIDKFMRLNNNNYKIDTRYTDYFGLNTTSAMNSVFRRF